MARRLGSLSLIILVTLFARYSWASNTYVIPEPSTNYEYTQYNNQSMGSGDVLYAICDASVGYNVTWNQSITAGSGSTTNVWNVAASGSPGTIVLNPSNAGQSLNFSSGSELIFEASFGNLTATLGGTGSGSITIDGDVRLYGGLTSQATGNPTTLALVLANGATTLTPSFFYVDDASVSSSSALSISNVGLGTSGSITSAGLTTSGSSYIYGGSITGGLSNTGTFNFYSGTADTVNSNSGTFDLSGGSITNGVTNTNNFNLSGGSIGSTITNNGGTFTFSGGSIGSTIANNGGTFTLNGGSITNGLNNASSGTVTYESGSFNSINNSGTFYVDANLTLGSNFTTTAGKIEVQSNTLTLGSTFTNSQSIIIDSGANLNIQNSFGGSGTITNNGSITVSGNATVTNSITNSNSMTVSGGVTLMQNAGLTNNGSLTLTGALDGNGAFSNGGTLSIASTGSFDMTGGLTNTNTISVYGSFTPNIITATSNSGTITVESGGSITGNLSGTTGAMLNIGSATSPTYSYSGTISGIPTININNSSNFTSSGAVSGVASGITVGSKATATFSSTVAGAGSLSNSGALYISGGGFDLTGGLASNTGTINVSGSFTPNAITANTGTINIESGASITGNISGTSTAILNIGDITSPTFSMSGSVSIPTLSVNNSSAYTANGAVSSIVSLTVGSAASATFNSSLGNNGSSTSPATISNSGQLTFGVGQTFAGFSTLNMASGSILNMKATSAAETYTLNGMTISGTGTNTGTFNITNTNSSANNLLVTTTSPITNLSAITLSASASPAGSATLKSNSTLQNISTITIGSNCTLELEQLQSGAVISGISSTVVNGTLQIDSGSSLTLDSSSNISGTGTIANYGQIIADGSFDFGGSFYNYPTGVFTIEGTAGLTFSGSTFVNQGHIIANFTSSNTLPIINTNASGTGLSLTSGTIQIGYTNNYIADGNYTFLTAPNGTPTPGAYVLPQTNFYISNWALSVIGHNLVVTVTRDGFGSHALTTETQQIGDFLEEIGAGNPTASQLSLLNALEKITSDEELTLALESLLPPQYTILATLDALDTLWGGMEIRLATVHHGFSAGDNVADLLGFWVRPFHTSGTQTARGTLLPFTDKTSGYIVGFDHEFSSALLLGIAGSYARTTVTDVTTPTTVTNMKTYMLTFYTTIRGANDSYFDALIAGGTTSYHGIRTMDFPGFLAYPSANYTSQQLTAKVMASKIWNISDLWQLTPWGMAQYSFVRQLDWTESGAGSYSIFCDPNNTNLFRLGVGANLELPFSSGPFLSIPGIYGGAYVDVEGGADVSNMQFIDGGPIITNTVQQGRIMLKIGGSYELKINDNLEFIGNYDYIVRHGFKGTEGFLNFRYTF